MKQVVVLSYNSVLRDARILKEADSLSRAGFKVKVFGFVDNNVPDDYPKVRESGAQVELIKPDLTRGLIGFIYYNYKPFMKKAISKIKNNKKMIISSAIVLLALLLAFFPGIFVSKLFLSLAVFFGLIFYSLVRYRRSILRSSISLVTRMLTKARRKLWDEYKADSLYENIIQEKFDIIHAHDLHTMPAAVKLKKNTGARLVWDAHEVYEDVAQLTEKEKEKAKQVIALFQDKVDFFITINQSIADFYKMKYPSLPCATIVKNATSKYIKKSYNGRLHEAAGLPITQKIVLYQGGFAEKRGLREAVAASEYFKDNLTLVMMGWGRLESDLKNIAADVNNKTKENRDYPAVIFVPPVAQADLPYWTSGAFVGLIPYEHHGLNHLYCTPNKLWEYPNADVPIVCTPMVEMRKVVSEWNIGWVLDDDLVATSIAERINGISDEDHFEKKKNCSVYIDQDNWSVYEKKLIKMYQKVA